MTRDEAKKQLLAWRGGVNAADSLQTEALRHASTDPDLAHWVEGHSAFQTKMAAQMQGVRIPPGLKNAILAGSPATGKILRPNFHPLVAWAAALAILLGVAAFYLRADPQKQLAAFRNRMISAALRNYRMEILTTDQSEIRSFLATNSWPADYQLPPSLQALPGDGAARLSWQGKPVSMVCLALNDRADLYLFVADQKNVPGSQRLASVTLGRDRNLATAMWRQNQKVYLLAGAVDDGVMRKFLP